MDVSQVPCSHCGTVNEIIEKRGADYNPLCNRCGKPLREARKPRLVHYGGGLYIQHIPGKGVGVFSRAPLKEGMLVERCAAYLISNLRGNDRELVDTLTDTTLHPYVKRSGTPLIHMCLPWHESDIKAFVLGNGMLYTHAPMSASNMRYKPYIEPGTDRRYMDFFARKDVHPGVELTITYNHPDRLWFTQKAEP